MKKLTVLIVEDDAQFRRYLHELLEKEYRVFEAVDGKEGWNAYLRQRPDLIITDIVMPEKEGLDLIMTIRKQDAQVPIIAMSSGGVGYGDSYLLMADKLGANAVLEKPFTSEELFEILCEQLGEGCRE